MKRKFTDEQIEMANTKAILTVAQELGLGLIEKKPGYYKVPGYGGLYINSSLNRFNCFSAGYEGEKTHGGGPIQLVMFITSRTFVEAVYYLLGVTAEQIYVNKTNVKSKPEIVIPEKSKDYRHIYAYLIKTRKIDRWVVDLMIKEGLLYENEYHSCVFVGYDFDGKIKHCAIRGTLEGNPFKGEAKGSDKQYAFHRRGITEELHVFEAPIDCMSYLTLYPESKNDHHLAFCCLADVNLKKYLQHNKISSIHFHLDNDKWGDSKTGQFVEIYGEKYWVVDERCDRKFKDWNEQLMKVSEGKNDQGC